jgi:arylsulfatase
MAIYAAMITRLDVNVGRVVDELRAAGQLDNTLILFMSDNGACAEWDPYGFDKSSGPDNVLHTGADLDKMGGPDSYISYGTGWANACNSPLTLYKHYIHEGGISSPLIVHWSARIRETGKWRHQVGHITDVMPTLLAVANSTYPSERVGNPLPPLAGISLLPALDDKPLRRKYLAWEHEGNRGLRIGDWKLVSAGEQKWELYNLAKDRLEQHDVAPQQPKRVQEMADTWKQWADDNNVYPKPPPKK